MMYNIHTHSWWNSIYINIPRLKIYLTINWADEHKDKFVSLNFENLKGIIYCKVNSQKECSEKYVNCDKYWTK
jgi:hypothetical protein